jgi:hypothetical protein
MTLIYKLAKKEPEILHELKVTLELIDQQSEISIRTCASKMLKRIKTSK